MAIGQSRLDGLWDYADAPASEARFRAAIAAEADAGVRAELGTQLARALGLQDRFAEADAELDAVERSPEGGASIVRARTALERGRLRNSAGDAAAAIPLFRDAAAVAESAALVFVQVDALHMLGIADAGAIAAWTALALQVLEQETDPRTLRWRVALHNNLGSALADAGDRAGALAEFEATLAAAERYGTAQQVAWAQEDVAEFS